MLVHSRRGRNGKQFSLLVVSRSSAVVDLRSLRILDFLRMNCAHGQGKDGTDKKQVLFHNDYLQDGIYLTL